MKSIELNIPNENPEVDKIKSADAKKAIDQSRGEFFLKMAQQTPFEEKDDKVSDVSVLSSLSSEDQEIEDKRQIERIRAILGTMYDVAVIEGGRRAEFNERQKGENKLTEKQIALTINAMDDVDEKKFDIKSLENIPEELHTFVAERIIEVGMMDVLEKDLDKFKELRPVVAEKLIEYGNEELVSSHLVNFSSLDSAIASRFMESGKEKVVVENLESFSGLDKTVAMNLIRSKDGTAIAENLGKFANLDDNVAIELMNIGKEQEIARRIGSFSEIFHKGISTKMIMDGKADVVVENIKIFSEVDYTKSIPKYPEGVTMKELFDISKQPGLGMKMVKELKRLEKFSFSKHVEPILNKLEENAHIFFAAVKDIFGEDINEREVGAITEVGMKRSDNFDRYLRDAKLTLETEYLQAA